MATAKKKQGAAKPPADSKRAARQGKPEVLAKPVKVRRSVRSAERVAAYKAQHAAIRAEVRSMASPEALAPNTLTDFRPGAADYTEELGARLYELIATGHSMDAIAALPGTPSLITMLRWKNKEDHPFAKVYNEAKQMLVPLFEERALMAAVTPLKGEVRTTKYSEREGTTEEVRVVDNVQRSELIMRAYQWSLSHLMPRKHGRNPEESQNKANEQLNALFDALKAGPQ